VNLSLQFYIMTQPLNAKQLATALSGAWLIDVSYAQSMQELLPSILNGSYAQSTNSDRPFRVDANGNPNTSGEVLVVPINGPMMKFDNCGSPGTATMADAIAAAQNDNTVKGIVLSIDSPGGSVDGTEELARTVAISKKKVVAFAHSNMASAAYWVGSQASEIVMSGRTTKVGSIGTMAILQKSDSQKQIVMFADRSKRKNASYNKAISTGETADFVNEYLNPLNDVFEAAVSRSREGKINLKKEDVLEGAVYVGNSAIKVGLADKMGSFQYAVKQSLTKNTMSNTNKFEAVQAAAQAPVLTQIEEGYVFTAEEMQNIETAIAAGSTAQEALAAAGEAQVALQTQLNDATAAAETANQTISGLQAEIAALKAQAPAIVQTAKVGADANAGAKTGWDQFQTSVDAEMQRQRQFLGN
jgi:ClpP class serine protease